MDTSMIDNHTSIIDKWARAATVLATDGHG
jgi:hypothetical protein